ncbi:MAG: hypothetical protein WBQ83_15180, partial [Candidatus Acidiferrales bacterium]
MGALLLSFPGPKRRLDQIHHRVPNHWRCPIRHPALFHYLNRNQFQIPRRCPNLTQHRLALRAGANRATVDRLD